MTKEREVWFKNILYLFENILEFWPLKEYELNRKINAVSRLIIYIGIAISIYRQKTEPMYFTGILLVVVLIYYVTQKPMKKYKIQETDVNIAYLGNECNVNKNNNPTGTVLIEKECQESTPNNPYANVLVGDKRDRLEACNDLEVDKNVKRYNNEYDVFNRELQSFYTQPVTTIPNDQGEFAKYLYGENYTDKTVLKKNA